MTSETVFREWHGADAADAAYPPDIVERIDAWKHIIYGYHDQENRLWMVVGIDGRTVEDLVAVEKFEDERVREYRMPMRFFRFMSREEIENLRNR